MSGTDFLIGQTILHYRSSKRHEGSTKGCTRCSSAQRKARQEIGIAHCRPEIVQKHLFAPSLAIPGHLVGILWALGVDELMKGGGGEPDAIEKGIPGSPVICFAHFRPVAPAEIEHRR